ncbi:MAG TPA: diguanylate cyclase [Usitatibacteraceae bacterium]
MKTKVTIDNVALATLIFAVIAISTVSTIAITSAENLVATNEKVLQTQRIVSSLEAIRFQSMALVAGEQNFIITGKDADLTPYRAGTVELGAELVYLAGKRSEHPVLAANFDALKTAAEAHMEQEARFVEARRKSGFVGAQNLSGKTGVELVHEKLLNLTYRMLAEGRRTLDQLEIEQISYGAKMRRLIIALICSSAFILVLFYGTLRRLNLEQRAVQKNIAYQATHDALTGLFNRAAVVEHLEVLSGDIATAAFGGFSVLLLDLDGFKDVNDSFGHDAGDELLKLVAARASAALRAADYLARLGGDEFLVVIPQVSDSDSVQRVADKLINALRQPYALRSHGATVTVSIGISRFPQDARDRETLMKCADLALYSAKRKGRNRAEFFTPELRLRRHASS